jgi:hypothetical protein
VHFDGSTNDVVGKKIDSLRRFNSRLHAPVIGRRMSGLLTLGSALLALLASWR